MVIQTDKSKMVLSLWVVEAMKNARHVKTATPKVTDM